MRILWMFFFTMSMILSCQSEKSKKNSNSTYVNEGKPETVQDAFEHVLNVLQDPFEQDHCFFKTNFDDIEKEKEFHVKDASKNGGKGSYKTIVKTENGSKKGLGNSEDTITYVYDNFQPKNSKIMVNGSLRGTRWNRDMGTLEIIKGEKLVFSGLFNAHIEFLNDDPDQNFEINNNAEDAECGSKTSIVKGKMMFVYQDLEEDNSIKFDSSCGCGDQARLERLLKVRDKE